VTEARIAARFRNNPHWGGSKMHFSALAMTTAAVLAFGGVPLHAQTWQMPPDNQRCPSKWGAGDQRGSANMMKPETVLRAAKLIKTGEVFELAAVLSPDPKEAFINTGRVFNIYTKPALPAANARQANEELVVTELGQIGKENQRYGSVNPCTGIAAAQWLVGQALMMIAADNCCVEVRPSEPLHNLPVHAMMLIQHGIYLIENLELEALAAARAYEFAFIVQPLKIKGGTGSAVAPIAIR